MKKLNLENYKYSERAEEILDNTKKSLGFVPNMYRNMAANTSLIDAYTHSYASFRANSGFNPVEQEVIFLSVAYENTCEYCMAAHSFVADNMTKVPKEVTDAIRDGSVVPDVKLAALSKLTRSLTKKRGVVNFEEIEDFLKVSYTESHVLGILTGIGVKTMSNYSNHITQPDLDATFSGRAWKVD